MAGTRDSALDKLGVGRGAQRPRVQTKVDKYPEVYSKEKEAAIKDFVRYFKGKMKIIRGLNEITKAASASDSKN